MALFQTAYCRKRAASIALWGISSCASAFDAIHLATQERPPYTWSVDGEPAGPFDTVVTCALKHLDIDHKIDFLPWARAQSLTEKAQIDGFYAGSRNAERNNYAVASRNIGKQNWAYFFRSESIKTPISEADLRQLRIGAYHGSNMSQWLAAKNIHPSYRPLRPDLLLTGLLRGRADVIIANEAAMMNLIQAKNKTSYLDHQIVLSKPLSVYFAKDYIKRHPDFLAAFNQAATVCLPKKSLVLYSQ